MALQRWKRISEEVLGKNPHFVYKRDRFQVGGRQGDYYYLDLVGAVVIVPVLPDGKLLLVKQFRYLKDSDSIEFPIGAVAEKDASLEQAAQRELKEETGYRGQLTKAGSYYPMNGVIRTEHHVFIARDLESGIPAPDEFEEFELVMLWPDEFEQMVSRGEIWDGPTLASWMIAKKYL